MHTGALFLEFVAGAGPLINKLAIKNNITI